MSIAFTTDSGAPATSIDMPRADTLPNRGLLSLIRSDAARWAMPGRFSDPAALTTRQILSFYYRYMGFRAAVWYRIAHWCIQRGIRGLPQMIQLRSQRRYGIEIVVSAPIGPGFYIAHSVGCVLAPRSIGANCSIISNVTLGMRNEWAFPIIGDNVFIGAGARVLGGIRLGDNSIVGANAVVVKDVAPATTVVGIPAKPIPSSRASVAKTEEPAE